MFKILVTGCAGFIGSHLCERLLADGHEITGIDNFDPFYAREIKEQNLKELKSNDRFKFYEVNITAKNELLTVNEEVDVIIHLAAKAGVLPSLQDPAAYIATNIVGTNNLLEWMKERSVKKLLFASSSSIYGNTKEIPFKETSFVGEPISPYAFTKRACELMNYTYHSLYGMDMLNLRLFTVYGPRQRPDLAIHKFVRLIDNNEPISMYGDGTTARDYTFVRDTVCGFVKALDYITSNNGIYEIINLSNHHPVTLKVLIKEIYDAMGKSPDIKQLPMQPGDVDQTYADISKAQRLFGYQPTTSLKEGLSSFIQWFYEQKA